jgi:hypothetical protein
LQLPGGGENGKLQTCRHDYDVFAVSFRVGS